MVVKVAFPYCSSLSHLLIAFLQSICMAVEDIIRFLFVCLFWFVLFFLFFVVFFFCFEKFGFLQCSCIFHLFLYNGQPCLSCIFICHKLSYSLEKEFLPSLKHNIISLNLACRYAIQFLTLCFINVRTR